MRVILGQVSVTLLLSLLLWVIQGADKAFAGLAGGACAVFPAMAYQLKVYLAGRSSANDALQGAYRAEAAKFAATTFMFALIFATFPRIAALQLFAVFIAALLVYPAALLFDRH